MLSPTSRSPPKFAQCLAHDVRVWWRHTADKACQEVMRRLGPTDLASSAPNQRGTLKRRRPYQDKEGLVSPLRYQPAPTTAAELLHGEQQEDSMGEEDSDSEGDDEEDSDYEDEDGDVSDKDAVLVLIQHSRSQPKPRSAKAHPAELPRQHQHQQQHQQQREQRKEGETTSGTGGEKLPKGLPSQRQKKQETEGGSSRGGGGGCRRAGEHKCQVCEKVFGRACKLVRHVATHTGKKPFKCDEDGCSKAFATNDKLKRHAVFHARRKAGLSVSVGDAARREAEVRQRALKFACDAAAAGISLELPAAGTCPYLPYTPSVTVPSLNEASRMERVRAASGGAGGGGAGGWKHSCPTCGRNFLDNYHLKRHVNAVHEGPRPYMCDHPVAAAAPVTTALGHVAAAATGAGAAAADAGNGEHGVVHASSSPGKSTAGNGQDSGIGSGAGIEDTVKERKGRRPPEFGVCGERFAKKWQLREHLYAEHGQTKFNSRQHPCPRPGCGRKFDRPSKLAAHAKTHEARFVCEFDGCGAAFVLASGLNMHLKEEHPFRCGVCGKLFNREDSMQIHRGTHSRAGDGDYVRPYTCHVPGCTKSFTEKRNLNAHRRTQHTEGGRKRFRCEFGTCAMAFAHRHTLVKHVKREHQRTAPGSDSIEISTKFSGKDTAGTDGDLDKRDGQGIAVEPSDEGALSRQMSSKAAGYGPRHARARREEEDLSTERPAGTSTRRLAGSCSKQALEHPLIMPAERSVVAPEQGSLPAPVISVSPTTAP